ncbi:hypothetical protein [Sulfitobacter profundi]|uniref:Uncharacterized protein n=1 Tax=Sulfitobacter profundi TaxID=2679961 RepID=A0ABW1YYL4_9RHOB
MQERLRRKLRAGGAGAEHAIAGLRRTRARLATGRQAAGPPCGKAPSPAVVAKPTSQKSAMLRSYLHQVEKAQLSQDLLRQDGGGDDTPFTSEMLVRNFEQIALYNEYDGNFSGHGGASPCAAGKGLCTCRSSLVIASPVATPL